MVDRIASFVRTAFRRSRFERELDSELRFHLDARRDDLVAAGMSPADAERQARLEFGSIETCRERCRESKWLAPLDQLAQDLRYALRLYRKAPLFSAVAILCLAFGVGVNTSVFSVLNYLLLKPLPVPGSDHVVMLSRGNVGEIPYRDYKAYRDRASSFAGLLASRPTESTLEVGDDVAAISAEAVSGNYAAVLGCRSALGRWFTDEAEPVAVISYRAWQRKFNADPGVLGKVIRSEKRYWTIIGVAGPVFSGLYGPLTTDLWVPLRQWHLQHGIDPAGQDGSKQQVMILGRLRDGWSPAQAAAQLNGIDQSLDKEMRRDEPRREPLAVDLARGILPVHFRPGARSVSALLLAVATAVLLIASLNVANLLLARGASRRTEIDIRVSLGAGRSRVFRQMMTESVVLVALGSVAGLVLGHWANRLLLSSIGGLPFSEYIQPDLSFDQRVFGWAWLAGLIAAVSCGLAPAWRSTRADPAAGLNGKEGREGGMRLQKALLVGQVALSLTLVCCAGMFFHSWMKLRSSDPGFAVKNRVFAMMFVGEPEFSRDTARAFYHGAIDRLRTTPGIRQAGLTHILPLYGSSSDCIALPDGAPLQTTASRVGDGFLSTLGIGIARGREFGQAERKTPTSTVIVNETLARQLWPSGDPIGRYVKVGCEKPEIAEVIGVARDSKIVSLAEDPRPHFYLPWRGEGITTLLVETSPEVSGQAVELLKRELRRPGVRIYAVKPLAEWLELSYWGVRWESWLTSLLGLLALLLAAVGLYGLMSYWVTLRTRELGIRMALGARIGQTAWFVCRQGLRVTAIGVVIGMILSIFAGWLLSSFLFALGPVDWLSLGSSAVLWLAIALVACLIPALRAVSVPLLTALRHE